ncbi:hypothetical protein E4V51_24540 [Paenibacillus sp. 28ISP30-2]|nr:hypothetical protein [Paenibacillus sp. 28ISP30-2]
MLSTLKAGKEQANGGKAIFFESVYTGSGLQISLFLPYEEDREDIHRIFQAVNDKILSDLTVTK